MSEINLQEIGLSDLDLPNAETKVETKVETTNEPVIKQEENKEPQPKQEEEKQKENQEEENEEGFIDPVLALIEDLQFEVPEGFVVESSRLGLYNLAKAVGEKEALDFIFGEEEQHPLIKDYRSAIRAGLNPEEFIQSKYANKANTSIDSEDAKVNVIKMDLASLGMNSTEVEEHIQQIKLSGLLDNQAKLSKTRLDKAEEGRNKAQEEAHKALQAKENEKRTAYWNQLKEVVQKSETIEGLRIPLSEREELIKYLMVVDDKGETQEMKDMKNLSIEKRVAIAELIRKNFKLGGYIDNEAKTQNSKRTQLRYSTAPKGTQAKVESTDVSNFASVADLLASKVVV